MFEKQENSALETLPNENLRTCISLILVIHLFCVAVMLSSNLAPSGLQARLVTVLAPYTKTLHLDPNFVPYHLTTGEAQDRFHQWTVQSAGGDIVRYPDRQWRGGFPRKRLETMTQVAAFYADSEMDEVPAELARGLAHHTMQTNEQLFGPQVRLVVRCLQYVGDDDPSAVEVFDTAGINVVYEADVWVDRQGRLSVLKRSPVAETAPPVQRSPAEKD